MKILLSVVVLFYCLNFSFGQKTTFEKHKENALFEERTKSINIKKEAFVLDQQLIDDSLKILIIDLMGHYKEFISVEFVGARKVIVEYQATLTDENVLKYINRRGRIFQKKLNNSQNTNNLD